MTGVAQNQRCVHGARHSRGGRLTVTSFWWVYSHPCQVISTDDCNDIDANSYDNDNGNEDYHLVNGHYSLLSSSGVLPPVIMLPFHVVCLSA